MEDQLGNLASRHMARSDRYLFCADVGLDRIWKIDAVLTTSRTSLGRLVQTADELVLRGQRKEGRDHGRT